MNIMMHWDYSLIAKKISENGHVLLSSDLNINSTSIVTIKCPKCEYYKDVIFFHYNGKSLSCFCAKKTHWTIDMAKLYVKTQGDILLSNEYKNGKQLLDIKCKYCDQIYRQTMTRYKMGFRHKDCPSEDYKRLKKSKLIKLLAKHCVICNESFQPRRKENQTCSKDCFAKLRLVIGKTEEHKKSSRKGAINSILSRKNRSKNEIMFANLVKTRFNNVLENVPMFDGWDSDAILPDLKITIHWNGAWHYKQICKDMSLEQAQIRDNKKYDVIEKHGYICYIIKDMGGFSPKFVEKEFETFLNYVEFNNYDSD